MRLVQTVAPVQEPISLTEAKDFLRVLDNDSDALISSLIVAVREHVENVTNRQLESATFELYAETFISKLPKNPINSILKIEYMDEFGFYNTLDPLLYYLYEEYGIKKIMFLDMDVNFNFTDSKFPTIQKHKEAVKITFTSGYTTVPEAIKQYMKVKISTLYENREQFVIGVPISEFGHSFVENLLSPYKVRSL